MIEEYGFGKIVIQGKRYSDDVKIIGDRIVHPWWRASGHQVDLEDVQDMLDDQVETLILGMGQPGRMQASSKLRSRLRDAGIELIEEPTAKAVERINDLAAKGAPVRAGLHLTC